MRLRALYNAVGAAYAAARGEKAKPLRPDDFDRMLRVLLADQAPIWWGRPDLRPYITYKVPVDITFVDGVADMTDPSFNMFLFESLVSTPLALVIHDDYEEPFSYTPFVGDLYNGGVVGGMARYALEGRLLRACDSVGITNVNGAARIEAAGFTPTVTLAGDGTLDDNLVPEVVKAMVAQLVTRPTKGGQ